MKLLKHVSHIQNDLWLIKTEEMQYNKLVNQLYQIRK